MRYTIAKGGCVRSSRYAGHGPSWTASRVKGERTVRRVNVKVEVKAAEKRVEDAAEATNMRGRVQRQSNGCTDGACTGQSRWRGGPLTSGVSAPPRPLACTEPAENTDEGRERLFSDGHLDGLRRERREDAGDHLHASD